MPPRPVPLRRPCAAALAGAALAALLTAAGPAAASGDGTVGTAFARAAADFGVPRDLLVAIGYGETRLDDHDGLPSLAGGYGVMHLVDTPAHRTLRTAAEETGLPAADLRRDTGANIRGAAAVLRAEADRLGLDAADRADPAAWYTAVARYGGAGDDTTARLYADTVYALLRTGIHAVLDDGTTVDVDPSAVTPELGTYADAGPAPGSEDYPPAHWAPAHPENYAAGRTEPISVVVIHVTQGSYAGSIAWFQDPAAEVSAHYVVRSADGDVTQMVRDADTAWHARDGNAYSIGIEHEGWVDDAAWFTDTMYRSSAALTRHLTDRYGIPRDRRHILGHAEVPGNDHTDPGPLWDWDFYMSLVTGDTPAA
ncbi:peptidoglycan recognition family protein [Streptomyces sp. RFCAC02]|uniref:N-acetylmuramoyl-L-alanine amidase n=1 Tax=Streptomyces sp. RFCAC02 TaxID=2499143 RepID=UPI003207B098